MTNNKPIRKKSFDVEIFFEAGSVLGINPKSNYRAVLSQKDVKSIIASDMRTIGSDIRRSANKLGARLYPSGKSQAEVGKIIGRSQSVGEPFRGVRRETGEKSFDKYADLYWATKS